MLFRSDDEIPPIVDVSLSLQLPRAPRQIILQPEGRALEWREEKGRILVAIDRVELHGILEIR